MQLDETARVRFIRNFTIEPIELPLRRELRKSKIDLVCLFGGFAEAAEEIESLANVEAKEFDATLTVLALGLETVGPDFGHRSWNCKAACERHLMLAREAVERCQTPLILNTVLPPLFDAAGLALQEGHVTHAQHVEALNIELRRLALAHLGRVVLVDWTAIARELGERDTYDYRFWLSSGAPFASAFLSRYAAYIASALRALAGKARKCLVLDCDNTLWGGIVGEDGRDGIRLSSDSLPGAYFNVFQRSVLDLQSRGVIIALCSKNNESDVLDVIDNHPYCLLRRAHLSAWRINWNEKVLSIAELSEELNIGCDAMVFIDDSEHECELMRSIHPEVRVLQTPKHPEELFNFLHRQHLFDSLAVTEDDMKRVRSYQQNRSRALFSEKLNDLSEYKQQLGTRLTFRRASRHDLPRVTQLIQRTNQFNLTTRRHDQRAIEEMFKSDDVLVACADVEDRFGQLGLVGVAIAFRNGDEAIIDSMLLSCRALGRDAEFAFAASLYRTVYREWEAGRVIAEYLPTPKNNVVVDFWLRAGLVEDDLATADSRAKRYRSINKLDSIAASIMPSHVTLEENTNE